MPPIPDAFASRAPVHLPRGQAAHARVLGRRLALAIGLICFVALLAYLGREGYVDAAGDEVTLLDAFYYATVSITTTGYGDVRPESDSARLVSTLLVTPARILFLILLVGTTLEFLAERTREAFEIRRWRGRLREHTIICGFGTKGRAAAHTLRNRASDDANIVVIDSSETAVAAAAADGLPLVRGDAAQVHVLQEAGVAQAAAVIVAPDRDDAAVLITLTARELNPGATIVAAVREDHNAHLLRQSGADSVITSSEAAGRLLGLATSQPGVVQVLEDLLLVGHGLDLLERTVDEERAGPLADLPANEPVVAVIRDGRTYRFDDPSVSLLVPGDRIVQLCSNPEPAPRSAASGSDPAAG